MNATGLLLIYACSLVAATAMARNWTGTLTQPVFNESARC